MVTDTVITYSQFSIKSILKVSMVSITALVIQGSLVYQLSLNEGHPDLFALLTTITALLVGARLGAIFGFLFGLLADLLVTTPYGVSSLSFSLLGLGIGFIGEYFDKRKIEKGKAISILVAIGAAFGEPFIKAVILSLLGQPSVFSGNLLSIIYSSLLFNFVLAVPVFQVSNFMLKSTPRDIHA